MAAVIIMREQCEWFTSAWRLLLSSSALFSLALALWPDRYGFGANRELHSRNENLPPESHFPPFVTDEQRRRLPQAKHVKRNQRIGKTRWACLRAGAAERFFGISLNIRVSIEPNCSPHSEERQSKSYFFLLLALASCGGCRLLCGSRVGNIFFFYSRLLHFRNQRMTCRSHTLWIFFLHSISNCRFDTWSSCDCYCTAQCSIPPSNSMIWPNTMCPFVVAMQTRWFRAHWAHYTAMVSIVTKWCKNSERTLQRPS